LGGILDRIARARLVLNKYRSNELFPPMITIVTLFIVSGILSPQFLTSYNQVILILQTVPLAFLALGASTIILMGSIDLSPGSVMGLTGVISAIMIKSLGIWPPISIITGILVGTLIGFINGLLVTKGKIFSFVATLATLVAGRGLILILTGGVSITGLSEFRIFSLQILNIPLMIWLLLLALIIHYLIIRYTTFGLMIYAIGGNEDAARYSGLKVNRVKLMAFTLAGTYYGIAGQLINARLEIAYPWAGWGYELDAIAASVLGGYQLSGGVGNPIGPLFGSYALTLLSNIFVLLGLDPYFQWVVKGVVLVAAASILGQRFRYVK